MAFSNPPPRGRKSQATALGAHMREAVGAALAARGLGEASLISHWPDIVGADIARFARFERLNWPPRGGRTAPEAERPSATLILRIDGAYALEAQHLAKLVTERINAHLGWRCIAKVAFRQGPLPEFKSRKRLGPASPEARARAQALVEVEEGDLRDALVRLGARVIDRRG
jgi:hypothetical protein